MTDVLDPPLPDDWSRSRLLRWSLAGFAALLLAAIRHVAVWGGGFAWLLNLGEALALLLFTLLCGTAFARGIRQAASLRPRFVIGTGVLLTALAALVPPFLSTDVFDYLSRGRLEHLGANPYVTSVADFAGDPRLQAFASPSDWTHLRMPYGPLAALAQWATAAFDAPWLGVACWKLLGAGAHVAAALLLFLALRTTGDERQARRGLVLWLWNPMLLLEGVVNAHNDGVLAALLAVVVLGVARGRLFAAMVAFGAALLWKHTVAPLGVLLLAHALWQRQWRAVLGAAGVFALVLAGCWWRYFQDPGALDYLWRQQDVVRMSAAYGVGLLAGDAGRTAVLVAGAALCLFVVARGAARAQSPAAVGGHALLATAVLLLAAPQCTPWYHFWWLPLLGLAPVAAGCRAAELLAWLGPLSYLVYAGTRTLGTAHQVWQYVLAVLWPLLLLVLEWRALAGPRKAPAATDA